MIVDDFRSIACAMARRERADEPTGELARKFFTVDIDKLTPADIDSIARWIHLEVSSRPR